MFYDIFGTGEDFNRMMLEEDEVWRFCLLCGAYRPYSKVEVSTRDKNGVACDICAAKLHKCDYCGAMWPYIDGDLESTYIDDGETEHVNVCENCGTCEDCGEVVMGAPNDPWDDAIIIFRGIAERRVREWSNEAH